MCVRENRERESMQREREYVCVCVSVCVCERETETERGAMNKLQCISFTSRFCHLKLAVCAFSCPLIQKLHYQDEDLPWDWVKLLWCLLTFPL